MREDHATSRRSSNWERQTSQSIHNQEESDRCSNTGHHKSFAHRTVWPLIPLSAKWKAPNHIMANRKDMSLGPFWEYAN